jgi:hypothetical protein
MQYHKQNSDVRGFIIPAWRGSQQEIELNTHVYASVKSTQIHILFKLPQLAT